MSYLVVFMFHACQVRFMSCFCSYPWLSGIVGSKQTQQTKQQQLIFGLGLKELWSDFQEITRVFASLSEAGIGHLFCD